MHIYITLYIHKLFTLEEFVLLLIFNLFSYENHVTTLYVPCTCILLSFQICDFHLHPVWKFGPRGPGTDQEYSLLFLTPFFVLPFF